MSQVTSDQPIFTYRTSSTTWSSLAASLRAPPMDTFPPHYCPHLILNPPLFRHYGHFPTHTPFINIFAIFLHFLHPLQHFWAHFPLSSHHHHAPPSRLGPSTWRTHWDSHLWRNSTGTRLFAALSQDRLGSLVFFSTPSHHPSEKQDSHSHSPSEKQDSLSHSSFVETQHSHKSSLTTVTLTHHFHCTHPLLLCFQKFRRASHSDSLSPHFSPDSSAFP